MRPAVAVVMLAALPALSGAGAQGATSQVVNACHVSPIVENLEASARFYHELLGLELNPTPAPGPLPVDADSGHLLLHGLPQARLRFIQARMAGVRCGIELVEWTNVDRHPIHRRYQDPGATVLSLTVRDLDAVFATLQRAHVRLVTTGARPIALAGAGSNTKRRAVTVQDPDGHYVELMQTDSTPETSPSSNVVAIGLRLTVRDIDDAVAYYRKVLGIDGRIGPYERDRARMIVAGLPEAGEYRTAMLPIPGSSRTLELIQFRGVDSRDAAAPSRVQDPGSYRLQLTFRDIDATLDTLSTLGSHTISTGGAPVTMTFGSRPWRLAVVPDPNNLFLIVQQGPG
jgi:catechol 2,3-dioxygenase-like lactoylglutathione lyase family enzyme